MLCSVYPEMPPWLCRIIEWETSCTSHFKECQPLSMEYSSLTPANIKLEMPTIQIKYLQQVYYRFSHKVFFHYSIWLTDINYKKITMRAFEWYITFVI